MYIGAHKKMILFRYSNYKSTDFIKEHMKVIKQNGYSWMLKAGKRSSVFKIKEVLECGGYLILKSPVKDGNKYYIATFVSFTEALPKGEDGYPVYYERFMNDTEDGIYDNLTYQWFKLIKIYKIDEKQADKIVLQINNKKVAEVMKTTRTALMFVENTDKILLKDI